MRTENEILRSWQCRREPLVSIICLTYNHEKFLQRAIEGFLTQVTPFALEIIIHDDASTDSTVDIINYYERKYKVLFRKILQSENQFSKGTRIIATVLPFAQGQYVALCEGDDYWTDKYKLQRQIAFLDANPEVGTCIHNVKVIYEEFQREPHSHFVDKPVDFRQFQKPKSTLTLEDLMGGNFIPTASVVFRNHPSMKIPEWFNKCSMGDWPLHVLNTLHRGQIGYMDEMMAVYRVHTKGFWSSTTQLDILLRSIKTADLIKIAIPPQNQQKLENTIVTWLVNAIKLMKNIPLLKVTRYLMKLTPSLLKGLRFAKIFQAHRNQKRHGFKRVKVPTRLI